MARVRQTDTFGGWQVLSLRCYQEGLALRGVKPAAPVHPLAAERERAILFEFLVASICHGTNWDRLRLSLADAASPEWFEAKKLAELSFSDFDRLLGAAFAGSSDLIERHQMFTIAAGALESSTSPLARSLLSPTPQRLAGSTGLYALLDSVSMFTSDPNRKKSRILVQQLYRYRLLDFVDPENFQPATEYHLIRLYLRTERVVHLDSLEFTADSTRAGDVRLVTALRQAVEQAMYYTADGAGMSVPELNEIEWQVARSYCERRSPRCSGPPVESKPIDQAILEVADGACPFEDSCRGPRRHRVARLTEPRLAEHHAYY